MSTNDEILVLPEVAMTDELAAAIQAAVSSADVRGLLLAEAEKQLAIRTEHDQAQADATQAAADKVAADAAAAAEIARANQTFTRDEVIGGKTFHFESSTEGELDRQILNAYKVAYNVQQPVAPVAVVDPAIAIQAAEAAAIARTELERKFRGGEVTAADYIEQTGALDEYLVKRGINPTALKEIVDENATTKALAVSHRSWEVASETFRNTVGADWPGGERNRELLGDKLAALGLIDAEDKVAAMGQAWAAMKKSHSYFPHGDADAPTPVAAAAVADPVVAAAAVAQPAVEAVRAAAAAKVRSMSSSLFGQSSGTSSAPVVNPAVVAASKLVPDNATPAEILQAWKDTQVANGVDPNAAFTNQFRAKAM
jgi:hypothetical protein